MSPEQCAGNNTDLRSDIYSLGVSMYECLTGQPPHVGTNAMQTIFKRATEDPPTFKQTRPDLQISPLLEAVVMKALERDPSTRYQNISGLKQDLQQFLSGAIVPQESIVKTVNQSRLKVESLSKRQSENGALDQAGYGALKQSGYGGLKVNRKFLILLSAVLVGIAFAGFVWQSSRTACAQSCAVGCTKAQQLTRLELNRRRRALIPFPVSRLR